MSTPALPPSFTSPPRGHIPPARKEAIRALLESEARPGTTGAEPSPRRNRTGLRTALVAASAAAVLAVSMLVAPLSGRDVGLADAATPPLLGHESNDGEPAAATLHALADALPSDDIEPQSAGTSHTVRTERWSLAVTEKGDAGAPGEGQATGPDVAVTTAVVPVLREVTEHPDGSVTVRAVSGEPQFPDDRYRRAWNERGRPAGEGRILEERTFEPGAYPFVYPTQLPTRPESLRQALAEPRPAADRDAGELLAAIADLRRERPLDRDEQRTLLRMLATDPGIVELGTTVDRAGREARAFAAQSDSSGWPIRHILLISTDGSRLLAAEQVLVEPVDNMDLPTPTVVDYTVFG